MSIITEDYRWPDMEIAAGDLRRWAMELREPCLVDIVNLIYHCHLARTGKSRFGDKTPIYFEIVPQLATLYPGAKFIHLIRDGRDVAISWIDVDWVRYYERDRFEWTNAMATRQHYLKSPYAPQILEVRYEDLVSDPKRIVRQICEFLGEQFEPAMLEWQHLTTMVPERERHIYGKLGQPVSSDNTAVWRRRPSSLECFAIEACLDRDLESLGYPLRFRSVGWRPLLSTTGSLLRASAPILRRCIPYLRRRNLIRGLRYI